MKSELASKLKDLLDQMSQDEFDKVWSEITKLEIESPSFYEFLLEDNSDVNYQKDNL